MRAVRLLPPVQNCYRRTVIELAFIYPNSASSEHKLTRRFTVDQADHGRRAIAYAPVCALALSLWLTACDPSPASRALREASAPPPDAPAQTDADSSGTAAAPASSAPVSTRQAATVEESVSQPEAPDTEPGALSVLGHSVPAGTSTRLTWSPNEVFEGMSTTTPVLVVNGAKPGPTLCLTAAIHGDELNGIEMVRRVIHELEPDELSGAVIGVPIVNLQGFRRGSRYLPDRRDLNRYFPGNPQGSSASRIAHSLFERIIRGCDLLVDLHTGSFYRTNLPQLRADLRYRQVRELTGGFGGMVVLHSEGAVGTLRRAATDAGIPAVTLEAGEPLRLQTSKVSEGVNGILALLAAKDMVKRVQLLGQTEPVFYESTWIRADHGGILFSVVRLGQMVEPGDVLGTITDPITNEQNLIYSAERGRVLGMALNQVVMPGFAAFRLGVETDGPPTDNVLAAVQWGQTDLANPSDGDDGSLQKVSDTETGVSVDLEPEEAS